MGISADVSISVIIPVHNAAEHLEVCLARLAEFRVAPLECIVVDDGSTDGSAEVARRFGAKVLSTGRRIGPARARNLGAKSAQGETLFFIDSDVCVHKDTLDRVRKAFREDPELDALIGSYDTSPASKDFLSQYKNLMHCFVHQHGRQEACTFWSGCGAIRREVFFKHAGFDESYERPAIEDIELGYRLHIAGRKVILDKQLLVTHLKRWTFWGLLKTDVLDRGIPWTELILRDRCMPNDLNLELSQRVSVALAFVLLGVCVAASVYWRGYFLTPLLAMLMFLLSQYWLESASGPRSKTVLLTLAVCVGAIVYLARVHHMSSIVPPLLLGCFLLFLRHRYGDQSVRRRKLTGSFLAVYILLATTYMVAHLPNHYLIFAFFVVTAMIVVLNNQFYLFLAVRQGRLFALAAVPFHLLYHLYNGISFLAGLAHYSWRSLLHRTTKPTQTSGRPSWVVTAFPQSRAGAIAELRKVV
jgi:GT2 family glycosyltransferase